VDTVKYNFMDNIFEMTLSQPVVEMFRENLLCYLEVEIMRGQVERLPNGQVKYTLSLNEEKSRMIKSFMVEMIKKQNYNAN
jgi:hypothetical protein